MMIDVELFSLAHSSIFISQSLFFLLLSLHFLKGFVRSGRKAKTHYNGINHEEVISDTLMRLKLSECEFSRNEANDGNPSITFHQHSHLSHLVESKIQSKFKFQKETKIFRKHSKHHQKSYLFSLKC